MEADVAYPLLYTRGCWLMALAAVGALVTLVLGPTAPYGRYSRAGWGPMLPARAAWLLQEAPSFLVAAGMLGGRGGGEGLPPHHVMTAGCFLTHYLYRAFIYPFLIKDGKETPLAVFVLAFAFCTYNGWLQGYYYAHVASPEPPPPARFWGGLAVWAIGLAANIHSDSILRGLRSKPEAGGKGGYRIPRGGLFEWVSGANFAGEMVEWAAWAVAVGSPSAAAFALFTACNVGPRAWQHHRWYLQRFPHYPKRRRAIIPFLL